MSFRAISARYIEPASIFLMIAGIVALCQPWHLGLHSWGVTITLAGLVGFNIAAHVPKPASDEKEA